MFNFPPPHEVRTSFFHGRLDILSGQFGGLFFGVVLFRNLFGLAALFLFALFIHSNLLAQNQDSKTADDHGHKAKGGENHFNLTVPDHPYDLLLTRPERSSVTLSILAYQDLEGYVDYGVQPDALTARTPAQTFKKGTPVELELNSLQPNTRYYYRFSYHQPSGNKLFPAPVESFHTTPPAGSTFTFTMTADVHLDEHTTPEVYDQSLANIKAEHPDFHIDLGNLFMTDKHSTREEAAKQYVTQRYYLAQIGVSVPILLAMGTHDGESSRYIDGTETSLAVWSNQIRTRYFPNPVPDDFYSGNPDTDTHSVPLQDYYAWEWGDALFVVLDPFRYSLKQHGSGGDGWGWSLGLTQYQWLEKTLQQSKSKFKFVIIHNLLSGDQASRGGVEIASLNEWGGKNADGTDGFKQHRPNWDMPVHQLLLQNHVAAVFKAHDNFYARQELDGILYLMVPQPSFAGDDRIRDLKTYGYQKGVFLGNSGHIRVTVSPDKTLIEYVKSSPTATVADAYTISAK